MSTNPPVVRPRRRSRDPRISGQLQRIPPYQRYTPSDPMRQHTTAYYSPQQLMAVHQILAHPNELPSRPPCRCNKHCNRPLLMMQSQWFIMPTCTPILRAPNQHSKSVDQGHGHQASDLPKREDQASNSRKVKFLCKHGGRQNQASPMYYNVARDQVPRHTTTAPSPLCADREECVEHLRSAMEFMEAGETERALEQVAMAPILPPPRS